MYNEACEDIKQKITSTKKTVDSVKGNVRTRGDYAGQIQKKAADIYSKYPREI